jgi:hypothetical protein
VLRRRVEAADALEAGPSWADAAPSPVADGALGCADEVAELLEQDQVVVVPVVGDADERRIQRVPRGRPPPRPQASVGETTTSKLGTSWATCWPMTGRCTPRRSLLPPRWC